MIVKYTGFFMVSVKSDRSITAVSQNSRTKMSLTLYPGKYRGTFVVDRSAFFGDRPMPIIGQSIMADNRPKPIIGRSIMADNRPKPIIGRSLPDRPITT